MSGKMTGLVYDRYPRAGAEFNLAVALADNAHHDGTHIFISVDSMAAKARLSVRSVQEALRIMLAVRFLLITRGGGGRGKFTEYRINPQWIAGGELLPYPEKGAATAGFTDDSEKGATAAGFAAPQGAPPNSQKGAAPAGFEPRKRVQLSAQKGAIGSTAYKNNKERSTPLTPQGGSSGFDSLLAEYPAHRRKEHQARKRWDEINPDERLQGLIVAAARKQAASAEWQANNGHSVPNLSGWLLNKGWRATHDEREAPAVPTAVASECAPCAPLTQEQRQANKQRARQLADDTRKAIAAKRLEPQPA